MSRYTWVDQYIRGSGLEIGGGHSPVPAPAGVQVTYVDWLPYEELVKSYPAALNLNYVVDDGEKLTTFPRETQDFVLNSHVLEHCQDVIGTLKNWLRVLKPGGYLWMAIPEKTQTFDRDRQVTCFDHLELDHLRGPEAAAERHYREYFIVVDKTQEPELTARVKHALENKVNIHFHAWDQSAMIEMFERLRPLGYDIIEQRMNGSEMIWLLRKK